MKRAFDFIQGVFWEFDNKIHAYLYYVNKPLNSYPYKKSMRYYYIICGHLGRSLIIKYMHGVEPIEITFRKGYESMEKNKYYSSVAFETSTLH